MKKISILQNCKNQLKNAFDCFINANGTNDKPAIFEYLNNVQDSILKDLHPSIKDSQKEKICNSLALYNCKLRENI